MSRETWSELAIAHWRGSAEPAVVTAEGEVSGAELLGLAGGAAAYFDSLDLGPGTAVPALMDETPTAIALAVGGALSRRPLAPLGTRLPVDDLVGAVQGLGSAHLLTSPDRLEVARQVADATGARLHVVDQPPDAAPLPLEAAGPDDTVVVVHTSGTTGRAKPVFMGQRAVAARIDIYRSVMGLGVGDRYCSASPFYHTAGVAMTMTVLGLGAAVIPQDWFSVDGWRRAGKLGMTCALLVPTMIDILLAEGALADASPRLLQYGAAPIHPATLTEALAALPETRFLQIFGQTEVSPVTYLDHDDHMRALAGRPELLRSVGRAMRRTELRIEHADGEGIGEIAVRAPHTFVTDADGWRRTGDLGRIDRDGYLTLHGRANDRIVRGGENVYPAEIEAALVAHPAVHEAAVVGVADRRWGEIIRAVVVPSDPDEPPVAEELRRFLADRVAHFKVPAEVVFVAELPRNPSGKVLRRDLKER